MSNPVELIEAISEAASEWANPEYTVRLEAEERLYTSPVKATQEAVAFAINQQMPQLSVSGLTELVGSRDWSERSERIGVVHKVDVPLEGLSEWLFTVLNGFEYIGLYGDEPNELLAAFVEDVRLRCPGLMSSFRSENESVSDLTGVISLGVEPSRLDALLSIRETDLPIQVLKRSPKYSVAVLDGKESKEECEDLAEDVLMHEGSGERNVCLIWAPEELNPDPYFESFAFFRGVYPAHERTSGSLQMKKAFLAAQNMPHAYGDGLEFLISRGEPACLEPCHIRWSTYESKAEVNTWIEENEQDMYALVARKKIHNQIHTSVPLFS
nr:hypothetical protein [Rhodothermaceae bacterium]